MPTTQAERQLRLDNLSRKLEEPNGGEVSRGVLVTIGLTLVIVMQLVLFAPVFFGR